MVEAMYERSPGFFKQFQKNFKYFISEEKLIFLVSRTLPFACILRVSTVIITLLIITMFLSTCQSSQQTFSNKQNRVQFRFFYNIQVSVLVFGYTGGKGRCFFKNSCWQWSTTKAISTDSQKQTLLLPFKSVCQFLRKMSHTNFNNLTSYTEILLDTKVWK